MLCRCVLELSNFPFDAQNCWFHLKLTDGITLAKWNKFSVSYLGEVSYLNTHHCYLQNSRILYFM